MTRAFFNRPLDNIATYWRIERSDGIALGFTTHDRALRFDGLVHRASPGLLPASIKRTIALSADDAEVEGALSHSAIREQDLAAGLFDDAAIEIGAVDWITLEFQPVYSGTLGQIDRTDHGFTAQLRSAKAELEKDLVPRTSPTCRAEFCGPGCNLSQSAFTQRLLVSGVNFETNSVSFLGIAVQDFVGGQIRFLEGPQTGLRFKIATHIENKLVLDHPLAEGIEAGMIVLLSQGCDHRFETCHSRFDNKANFRGEPFIPGNDSLARYGTGA